MIAVGIHLKRMMFTSALIVVGFFYETSIGNDVLNTESLISVTYLAVMLVLIATGGFIVLVSQVFFGSLNTLLNTQKMIIKSDELPKL